MAVPVLVKAVLVWVGSYLVFRFGIQPALPVSLLFMYLALTTVGILVYVSLFEETLTACVGPIVRFLKGEDESGAGAGVVVRVARWGVLVAFPVLVGGAAYSRVMPRYEPPTEQRVVHPAPPREFISLYNPFRDDKARLAEHVREGAAIYFQNCVFCHGDALNGRGHFAHGFNLPPANFVDPGTIAQLQEAFVFWRVSRGGPGLPDESTPWNSAMPQWETMLTEPERWKVIMYLYDATGYAPRTWE